MELRFIVLFCFFFVLGSAGISYLFFKLHLDGVLLPDTLNLSLEYLTRALKSGSMNKIHDHSFGFVKSFVGVYSLAAAGK